MGLRAVSPPPLTFTPLGVPGCPHCALLVLPTPLVPFPFDLLGPLTPPERQPVLATYHECDHLPRGSDEGIGNVVAKLLASYRYSYGNERALRDHLARVLHDWGLAPDVEHRLGPKDRIDIYLPHLGFGVEVKVAGGDPFGRVLAQVDRYLRHGKVHGVILVTANMEHGPSRQIAFGGYLLHIVQLGTLAL